MNRARKAATIVLAAGAAASIATSQATWDRQASWPMPSIVMDEAAPLVGYQVRAELRGPLDGPYGDLLISLDPSLVPGTSGPAWVTVTIQPDADPEQVTTRTFLLGPGQEPPPWTVSTELWQTCQSPCVESFQVWLDLDSNGPETAVALEGSITATVTAVGDDPSAEIELEVTPLTEAP